MPVLALKEFAFTPDWPQPAPLPAVPTEREPFIGKIWYWVRLYDYLQSAKR